jgi:hypothetical protein
LEKNWKPHLIGRISHSFYERVFFSFLFEKKEDRDLIFKSGLYFMGARVIYLNHCTLVFNQKMASPLQFWYGSAFPSFPYIVGMKKLSESLETLLVPILIEQSPKKISNPLLKYVWK